MRCWSTLNFFGFLPIIFGAFNNQKLSYFVKRIYVLFLITYSGNNKISYEWKFYLLLKHAQFLSTQYQSVSKIIFQLHNRIIYFVSFFINRLIKWEFFFFSLCFQVRGIEAEMAQCDLSGLPIDMQSRRKV